MRNLLEADVERYRRRTADVIKLWGFFGDETCGAFDVPYPPTAVHLKVIASANMGWDHVSVSLPKRCPNWFEMSFIHRMFFEPHETAMQLHVPESEHVNQHPFCLHLWRPHGLEIPKPPAIFVGLTEPADP